jgi:hypothetical protein
MDTNDAETKPSFNYLQHALSDIAMGTGSASGQPYSWTDGKATQQ